MAVSGGMPGFITNFCTAKNNAHWLQDELLLFRAPRGSSILLSWQSVPLFAVGRSGS